MDLETEYQFIGRVSRHDRTFLALKKMLLDCDDANDGDKKDG